MSQHAFIERCRVSAIWLVLLGLSVLPAAADPPAERAPSGGGFVSAPADVAPLSRQWLHERIESQRSLLQRQGLLTAPAGTGHPTFAWPLRAAAFLTDPGFHAIDAFVDHDPGFPGQLLDYACGNRTYDTAEGYNHAGSDFFLWPFSWRKVEESSVEVVAAAPGILLDKADGRFDHRCSCLMDDPNYVIVQHADGSVAWYFHMKNGSITTKAIGQPIATGEYLGVVASSGCSSGPHLHFEVHANGGALIDPYVGACNATSAESWWAAQRPYYDSAVNAVATHSAPPEFPTCPQEELPHFVDELIPGQVFIVAVYYRDQQPGEQTQMTIRRPDDTVFDSWLHTYPGEYYAASYWYWILQLPSDAPEGLWKVTATYLGLPREHTFRVTTPIFADGFETGSTSAWSLTLP